MAFTTTTYLIIALVLSAAATTYSITASQSAAKKQRAALEDQAQKEREAAKRAAAVQRRKAMLIQKSQAAQFAGSGVSLDSGTVTSMLDETYSLGESDALNILQTGFDKASYLENQGKLATDKANAEAIGAGLSFAGKAASSYSSYSNNQTTLLEEGNTNYQGNVYKQESNYSLFGSDKTYLSEYN